MVWCTDKDFLVSKEFVFKTVPSFDQSQKLHVKLQSSSQNLLIDDHHLLTVNSSAQKIAVCVIWIPATLFSTTIINSPSCNGVFKPYFDKKVPCCIGPRLHVLFPLPHLMQTSFPPPLACDGVICLLHVTSKTIPYFVLLAHKSQQ